MNTDFDLDVEHTLDGFAQIVSDHCGLVRPIIYSGCPAGDPRLFLGLAPQADYKTFGGVGHFAAGAGSTLVQSMVSCLGEAVERYSGGLPNFETIRVATYAQLAAEGHRALDPETYQIWLKRTWGHPRRDFDAFRRDTLTHWIRGSLAEDGAEFWVPADGVHWLGPSKETACVDQATTSGLGAGASREHALASSLLELIERDHYAVHWWTKTPGLPLDWQKILGADPEVQALLAPMRSRLHQLKAYLLRSDLDVPVCVFVARGRNQENEPSFVTAAAANLDPRAALRKSMLETLHIWMRGRLNHNRRVGRQFSGDPDQDIMSFVDRIEYYHRPERLAALDFLDAGDATQSGVEWQRLSENWKRLRGPFDLGALHIKMRTQGMRWIQIDMTTPEIAALGYHVQRAFVPELVPIDARHVRRPVNHPRIRSWGMWANGHEPEILNEDAHPFP